jgi:hypothetical protein
MRLIRTLIRTFLAWTIFIFILGALFAEMGGQRNHRAVLIADVIFLVGLGYGIARWRARRRARREAEQAAIETPAEPVYAAPGIPSGQGVTAVTVPIGHQPGQVGTVASEVLADTVPFATTPATVPAPEADTAWEADVASEPPVVDLARVDLPGSRGARMALAGHAVDETPPGAIGVRYRGEVKAYVTRESWEQVGDFAELTPDDPEYRLVALMSVYAQHVLCGFETEYTDADALSYALAELVPHEMLERDIPDLEETAKGLGIPVDALTYENLRPLRVAIAARNSAEARAEQQVEQ